MKIHLTYTATEGTGGKIAIVVDGKEAGYIERVYGDAVVARNAAEDQMQRYGRMASRRDDTFDFANTTASVAAIAEKLSKWAPFDDHGRFEALRRYAEGGAYKGTNKKQEKEGAKAQAARVAELATMTF